MGRMAARSTPEPVPLSVRAQLLATEHSGLVAARSAAQSEMLTRITIVLTLVSAGLVSLALVGQATGFAGDFGPFSIAVLTLVAVVGTLTQIRVIMVAHEDLMYVLAMNRLRAAYFEIDPSLAPYFMTSPHDDRAGSRRTYDFFDNRPSFIHVGGSSMVLVMTVNSALLGLLGAAIAKALAAPTWALFLIAIAVAVAFWVASLVRGERSYRRVWVTYLPVNPTVQAD